MVRVGCSRPHTLIQGDEDWVHEREKGSGMIGITSSGCRIQTDYREFKQVEETFINFT